MNTRRGWTRSWPGAAFLLLLTSTALAAQPGGTVTGVLASGESFTATDHDGDGLPDTITVNGNGQSVGQSLAPGMQIVVNGVTVIVGTTGDDVIDEQASAGPVIAFGGPGDDGISGSQGGDALYGGDGDDMVYDAGGDDQVHGGDGDDGVGGGDGDDIVNGGDGNDYVAGGNGDDSLDGGEGDDIVSGGPGDDRIDGTGGGADSYEGDEGADTVSGSDGEGDDEIDYGSPGGDTGTGPDGDPDTGTADADDTVLSEGPEDHTSRN